MTVEQSTIPYGFCQCGCGERTAVTIQAVKQAGLAKGQPRRFLQGHGSRIVAPLAERIAIRTRRSETPHGCWEWTGHLNEDGYGIAVIAKSRTRLAHRVAWELASSEPVPSGLYVLHTCDNPACIRNDEPGIYVARGIIRPRFGHIWLGTQFDNMADMIEKGRKRHGWRDPLTCARGEQSARALLTEVSVREIRRLKAVENTPNTVLAKMFGVKTPAIWAVVHQHTWKHVT